MVDSSAQQDDVEHQLEQLRSAGYDTKLLATSAPDCSQSLHLSATQVNAGHSPENSKTVPEFEPRPQITAYLVI